MGFIIESTSTEIDTGEYDENSKAHPKGEKVVTTKEDQKKETSDFIGLNNAPIIKCAFTDFRHHGLSQVYS